MIIGTTAVFFEGGNSEIVLIDATGTVAGTNYGIWAVGSGDVVTNYGSVSAGAYDAIRLGAYGAVNNAGRLSGDKGVSGVSYSQVRNSGTINARTTGVSLSAYSSVSNSGSIYAATGIAALSNASIVNTGYVSGTYDAVSVQAGSKSRHPGGRRRRRRRHRRARG